MKRHQLEAYGQGWRSDPPTTILVTEKARLPYKLSKLHTESKMPTTDITECELDIII